MTILEQRNIDNGKTEHLKSVHTVFTSSVTPSANTKLPTNQKQV
jgi:hypothetical protein